MATNSNGTDTQKVVVNVAMPPIPIITNASSVTIVSTKPFSYSINATNAPSSFGVTNLPAGLSLDTTLGLIMGIPTTPGTYSVTLKAINASGVGSATVSFNLLTAVSAPWQDTGIGKGDGYAAFASSTNTFTVAGSGANVAGQYDGFY